MEFLNVIGSLRAQVVDFIMVLQIDFGLTFHIKLHLKNSFSSIPPPHKMKNKKKKNKNVNPYQNIPDKDILQVFILAYRLKHKVEMRVQVSPFQIFTCFLSVNLLAVFHFFLGGGGALEYPFLPQTVQTETLNLLQRASHGLRNIDFTLENGLKFKL